MDHAIEKSGRPLALVVDDHKLSLILTKAVLELFGVDVVICENGALGAAAFTKNRYDIVFMNRHMPELSGVDATQCIRAHERVRRTPRTPIIAITAGGLPEEKNACLDAGMDDVLVKPFDLNELRELLVKWIAFTTPGH